MGSTQETRHGRRAEIDSEVEGRSAYLGLVTQSIIKYFCLVGIFGHIVSAIFSVATWKKPHYRIDSRVSMLSVVPER